MNSYQCKQYIHYLYGLYVYLTYVHICIHGEISINYLPNYLYGNHLTTRLIYSFLRQINETHKSSQNSSFISQHIEESHSISRDINPDSN